MLRALTLATLAVLLAACAETPQRPESTPAPVVYAPADSGPMLARDASFIVVVPRAGEDFGALAERWLGDRSRRFEIAEFNRQDEARALRYCNDLDQELGSANRRMRELITHFRAIFTEPVNAFIESPAQRNAQQGSKWTAQHKTECTAE